MRKQLFWSMFVTAGMLLATSCSKEDLNTVQSGSEAQVTFSLGLEGGIGTKTRAISDGLSAKKLVYAVYDEAGEIISTIAGADDNGQIVNESAFADGLTDNVKITLAKGQTYTVVFWAQNSDCKAYTTTNLKNVEVSYDGGQNNDESRDAFFRAETFTVSGNRDIPVTLKRPFAQINVGVTEEDWTAAVASGVTIEKSKVVIKNAATAINLLDGSVSGEARVTYDFGTIPAAFDAAEDLTVNDKTYKYLSMSYILTGADKSTLEDLQFIFKPETGNDIVFDEGLSSVPVQRNWRTNIIGELLTEEMTFNITIDPIYAGDYNYPEFATVAEGVSLDENNKTYYLSSKAGLTWFANQTNKESNSFEDYTVKLTSDIDLVNEKWTPIGTNETFRGTFDGGNYTIRNMTVAAEDGTSVGLFATAIGTVKNVKLKNVDITGHWKAGAVVGDGLASKIENCHVDGGTITITPRLVNGSYDDANNVGGIVGYLSAEPDASCKDCSVNGLTITAYRDCGGVVGTAQWDNRTAPVIGSNTVSNTRVIANQLAEYKESKDPNAGTIVGRNLASADLSTNNSSNNVTVTVLTVSEEGKVEVGDIPMNILNNLSDDVREVTLTDNMTDEAEGDSGYGKTGIVIDGIVLDGGGRTITVNGANNTWESAINIKSGTLKNATVTGAFRGIFLSGTNGNIVVDNVILDGVCYTFNSDAGNKEYSVEFSNSTLNGWTSFSDAHKLVTFSNCKFGKGTGSYTYAYCRPYNESVFEDCIFEEGFEFDSSKNNNIKFRNCYVGKTLITGENVTELLGEDASKIVFEQ